MSDGEHFLYFPRWENMTFTQHCNAWVEWYATFIALSPWNSTRYLDGDAKAIFNLFNSSVPGWWHKPNDWTEGIYHSHVLEWYGFNY